MKKAIEIAAKETGDLIINEIADAVTKSYVCSITKALATWQQNNSEKMSIIKKYLKKDLYLYISRGKAVNYWWSEINIIDIAMQYKRIIDLLTNTPNQSSKFRTKNWVEINDCQIKFKT